MGLRTWLGLKKPRKKRDGVRGKRKATVPGKEALATETPQLSARQAIRIFRAEPMERTPFDPDDPPPWLKAIGVTYVTEPDACDIILSRFSKDLRPFGAFDKQFAIYTHEPRYAPIRERVVVLEGVRNPVHCMTAHNGTMYSDLYWYGPQFRLDFDRAMNAFRAKPNRTVILASFHGKDPSLVFDGVNIDLYRPRRELAMLLHKAGHCDIFGKGWPDDVTVSGISRDGPWHDTKMVLLGGYKINIAFENTIIPYYISEKLWDAIAGACMPVYHGEGTRIYDVFPRGSFIEGYGKSADELKDEILTISGRDLEARYEVCLRRYIELRADNPMKQSRAAREARITQFLRDIKIAAPARAAA